MEWQDLPWSKQLAMGLETPAALLRFVGLSPDNFDTQQAHQAFKTRVPHSFAARIQKNNPYDPLLKQVLALDSEMQDAPGYHNDPLKEQAEANPIPGVLHKYQGRLLLMLSGSCAINCRYCFRRHFPYHENRLSPHHLGAALAYIQKESALSEIILSGGDPLMLKDTLLSPILKALEEISHIKRVRIHTRLPVVLPARITPELIQLLSPTRLHTVMVLHINHAQECNDELAQALLPLKHAGIPLLNQSVLLKGVNDTLEALVTLSERLFEMGVLPYYLHLLDQVKGAQGFEVPQDQAKTLYHGLQTALPGYLVPKCVREVPGVLHKVGMFA